MPGAGVGGGQDHDALTAARFELSIDGHQIDPKIANSIQNARVAPDGDELEAKEADDLSDDDAPSTLSRLSEASEMTSMASAGDTLGGLEDMDMDEVEAPDL